MRSAHLGWCWLLALQIVALAAGAAPRVEFQLRLPDWLPPFASAPWLVVDSVRKDTKASADAFIDAGQLHRLHSAGGGEWRVSAEMAAGLHRFVFGFNDTKHGGVLTLEDTFTLFGCADNAPDIVYAGVESPSGANKYDLQRLLTVGHADQTVQVCFNSCSFASCGKRVPRVAEEISQGLVAIPDLASRVGATHWAGTYNLTTKPYLVEGAEAIAAIGARAIKLTLDSNAYRFNSEWPDEASFANLVDVVRHPYYKQVLEMDFDTIVLMTYERCQTGPEPKKDPTVGWGKPPCTLQQTTKQFDDLATYLLTTYADAGKRFVLQNWEGEWQLRPGYDWLASEDSVRAGNEHMALWLAARQKGVDDARDRMFPNGPPAAGRTIVLHAAEVVLAKAAMLGVLPNGTAPMLSDAVLPSLRLDMASYSAYETMFDHHMFAKTLRFIASRVNRTRYSPPFPVAVGEYSVGDIAKQASPSRYSNATMDSVSYSCVHLGCVYWMYWEIFNNERKHEFAHSPLPDYNLAHHRGYWLLRPDGTHSTAYTYLERLLHAAAGTGAHSKKVGGRKGSRVHKAAAKVPSSLEALYAQATSELADTRSLGGTDPSNDTTNSSLDDHGPRLAGAPSGTAQASGGAVTHSEDLSGARRDCKTACPPSMHCYKPGTPEEMCVNHLHTGATAMPGKKALGSAKNLSMMVAAGGAVLALVAIVCIQIRRCIKRRRRLAGYANVELEMEEFDDEFFDDDLDDFEGELDDK